jgi:glucoamylase
MFTTSNATRSIRGWMTGVGPVVLSLLAVTSVWFPTSLRAQDSRLDSQVRESIRLLSKTLDGADVSRGAVPASPSKVDPNYFFHWTRDAAVVLDAYVTAYARTRDSRARGEVLLRLLGWVEFETRLQGVRNRSGGQGEPKFMISGDPYNGEWGRPQNDGPALRAIVMTRLANLLLDEGQESLVRNSFYGGRIPPIGPIKVDLEYTAHHWTEASYDLWEEVKGSHFYTRIVQRRALLDGAKLADRLGDPGAADFYRQQARLISTALLGHMQQGLVMPTLDRVAGWSHKVTNLDVAVVLGALHGFDANDDFFAPSSDWIVSSAAKLEDSFLQIYPLNRDQRPAPAIGRYPEDVYDGTGFTGGNPWFLATNAYAEMTCRLAQKWEARGVIEINDLNRSFLSRLYPNLPSAGRLSFSVRRGEALFDRMVQGARTRAEGYLQRTVKHNDQGPVGHISEQFSRNNGYMLGAPDLSWSYASFISAYVACYNWLPRVR